MLILGLLMSCCLEFSALMMTVETWQVKKSRHQVQLACKKHCLLHCANSTLGIEMTILCTNPILTEMTRNGLSAQKSLARMAGRSAIYMTMAVGRLRKEKPGVDLHVIVRSVR